MLNTCLIINRVISQADCVCAICFCHCPRSSRELASGSVAKNQPASAEDTRETDLILGQEDPLEEEMATPSSDLAWRIPRTEDLAGCSSWSRKGSDMTKHVHTSPRAV